ncbi:hypothetical protein BDZ97DRAFT_1913513 [Flammula alnicola]|nr:hypothetical protein BDZ97DRAFT_1913513 [Flammula alnicola]
MSFATKSMRRNFTSSHLTPLGRGTRCITSSPVQDLLNARTASLSQGHVTDPTNNHSQDIQSQYVRGAKAARSNLDNYGIDAASPNIRPDPNDRTKGNPEGMGMLDQVGSATGTARFFESGGKQGDANLR